MLSLHRLRLLVELERRGTVAAVADELGYTPSAVSQQLGRLETESRAALLEKVGRGVRLTDAGRVLASHGRELLARAEAAEADVAALRGVAGTLRIAAFQTAARALVTPAMADLRRLHPALQCRLVDLEAEQALPLLRAAELDVVVAEEYEHAPRPLYPDVERHELLDDELMVALPADHAAARDDGPLELSVLAAEPWATPRAGTAYADMLERTCRTLGGFEPDVRHRVNDLETMLELAAAGLAVALVPWLGGPARRGDVVVRPLAGGGISRSVFAAVRAGAAERPAVGALLGALRP
jgi:DNA-binding transcriptional LysR family regulator